MRIMISNAISLSHSILCSSMMVSVAIYLKIEMHHPENSLPLKNVTSCEVISYPWLVSIETSDTVHMCTGSILTAHVILTAANCADKPPFPFYIRYGICSKEEKGIRARVDQQHFVRYCERAPDTTSCMLNVMLMRTRDIIQFSLDVQPALWPGKELFWDKMWRIDVVGWCKGRSVVSKNTLLVVNGTKEWSCNVYTTFDDLFNKTYGYCLPTNCDFDDGSPIMYNDVFIMGIRYSGVFQERSKSDAIKQTYYFTNNTFLLEYKNLTYKDIMNDIESLHRLTDGRNETESESSETEEVTSAPPEISSVAQDIISSTRLDITSVPPDISSTSPELC